jgi:hypothetical protein
MGSAEHARVRQYLVEQLTALGCDVDVQATTGVHDTPPAAGDVQNVLCRVRGSQAGPAVMLAAHYDGVPTAPAAGDDGAGVAALLETLRALHSGPALRNDVIFLFTDGEEDGLLGASAFTREHRWARNVGLVLNFEARGTTGPSLLFEASPGNGWLIRQVTRAAAHPVGSSLFYAIYRSLPNDTDLTIFKQAGWQGLNFAFVGGLPDYHTARDVLGNLDRRSLAHHGSYALALVRHFGNLDLGPRDAPDVVFFNLLGAGLVVYPESWSLVMFAVLFTAFVLLIWLNVRRHRLTALSMFLGVLGVLVALVITVVASSLLWELVRRLHGTVLESGRPEDSTLYLVSFLALGAAATLASYRLLRPRVGVTSFAFGSATIWLLLSAAVTWLLPSGSYFVEWPLASALLALGAMTATDETRLRSRILTTVVWCLTAALPIAIVAPMIAFIYMGLGLNIISVPVLVMLVGLTLWLLIPVLELLTPAGKWHAAGFAALTWLGFLLGGAMSVRYDRDHPRKNQIIYSMDADSRSAKWATFDERSDSWSVQFLTTGARWEPLPALIPDRPAQLILQHPAPLLELPLPEVKLLHDSTTPASRTLTLLLRSPRGARMCLVYAAGPRVLAAHVSGRNLVPAKPGGTSADSMWKLQYTNLPLKGTELVLEVQGHQPLRLRVVEVSHGLPALGSRVNGRTEDMMEYGIGDVTVVSRAFQF